MFPDGEINFAETLQDRARKCRDVYPEEDLLEQFLNGHNRVTQEMY